MPEQPREPHPAIEGERVVLRSARTGETERLASAMVADSEVSPWWTSDVAKMREWLEDPDATLLVIDVGGDSAGIIMYYEEDDPDYRYASIDMSLLSPWIGAGLGSDALRTLARHMFEVRGHHRIQIDPAVTNERAIRAYKRVGFKPVGVMRRAERGPDGVWHDVLLMDLLAEELD